MNGQSDTDVVGRKSLTQQSDLDEAVRRRWTELVPLVDRLVQRGQTQGEWRTHPKSVLAIDDVWILGPEQRSVRVERTLRWHVRNVNDQHAALDRFGHVVAGRRSKGVKIEELKQKLMAANGQVPDKFTAGYWSETVVKYADEYEGLTGKMISNQLAWQLCSGFAHGRPWAHLGFLDRETVDTDDEDVVWVRMTSDLTRSILAPDRAIQLCATLLRRHAALNTPLLH